MDRHPSLHSGQLSQADDLQKDLHTYISKTLSHIRSKSHKGLHTYIRTYLYISDIMTTINRHNKSAQNGQQIPSSPAATCCGHTMAEAREKQSQESEGWHSTPHENPLTYISKTPPENRPGNWTMTPRWPAPCPSLQGHFFRFNFARLSSA